MSNAFRIGWLAVIMLVLLRVSIGWHFLYEGVWKYTNPSFSSEAFLSQARGPFAEKFQALVPDSDGRERLDHERRLKSWRGYRDRFAAFYKLTDEQLQQATAILERRQKQLEAWFSEETDPGEKTTRRDEIQKYLAELDALRARRATDPAIESVPYQQRRYHDKQNELRAQAGAWLAELAAMERGFRGELEELLTASQRQLGSLREPQTQLETIDKVVTYGLIAIGLCLMVGLLTRVASVLGAAFLVSVILAQPALPWLYPPLHPSAGHALVVNKEFIEMVALLALAALPVGRWGGLDFFLHHLLFSRCCSSAKGKRDAS